jgi:hypothetical protein
MVGALALTLTVKLGGDRLIEEGKKNLLKLASRIDTGRMQAPSFMMILCAVAPFAYTDEDGITVAPISCLRP